MRTFKGHADYSNHNRIDRFWHTGYSYENQDES